MVSSEGVPVIVWTPVGECENGFLKIEREKLVAKLESGSVLSSQSTTNSLYRLHADSDDTSLRIHFDPLLIITRPYERSPKMTIEDVFPPSTGGFYGRIRSGKRSTVFIVQDIEKDTRKWLLIGDPETGRIFETQIIQQYEVEALTLFDNHDHRKEWDNNLYTDEAETMRAEVLRNLDKPSPSWEEVSKLLTDVTIRNLKLGNSMKETLSQLVPSTFPEYARDELMAFLAFVSDDETLVEDPIDFSFRTYLSLDLYGVLVRGHLRCVNDKADWPPYIKLMELAARGQLQQPKAASDATVLDSPLSLFHQKVNELFPNWIGIMINATKKLDRSGKIRTRVPATRSQAIKSESAWKERLAAVSYGPMIRGQVNADRIGLSDLVYLGAAYRWPHRHMKFITRLGPRSENPPYMHLMTMPQSAVERVKRFLPSIMEVAWSAGKTNLDLFHEDSNNWEVPVSRIVSSMNRKGSMKKLAKQFTTKSPTDIYRMSKEEARVTGLVTAGIYLLSFEKEGYFRYWNLKRKQIHSILSELHDQGVVNISYEVEDSRLVSIATVAQGEPEHVASLVESFLDYTPTSLAMLNDGGDTGIIISKLTEESAYEIATAIPRDGIQSGLNIRCLRPTSFRSFTYDLYHRLLKDDGTWDDDVSAFLSQARSKRKELSEGNA